MTRRLLTALTMIIAALGTASPGAAATALVDPTTIGTSEELALLERSLEDLTIEIGGDSRKIAEIHLHGLQTIDEESLLRLLTDRLASPLSYEKAVALIRALAASGLFSRITPTLRIPIEEDAGLMLDLLVEEHPIVRDFAVRSSGEILEGDVMSDLLRRPSDEACEDMTRNPDLKPLCPPVDWFARFDGDEIVPGILWHGPSGAARRVLSRLFEAGYRMAAVTIELSPEGTLMLEVDEGRIDEVQVSGVAASLIEPIRGRLALEPERVFLDADAVAGMKRVERDFPFIKRASEPRRTRALPDCVEEKTQDGRIIVRTRESAAETVPAASYVVEGHTLKVFFRSMHSIGIGFNASELLRHTPAGGVGIGAETRISFWDSKNRVQLHVEGFSAVIDEALQETLDRSSGEVAIQLRFQVPPLHVAELGAEAHERLETPDEWRMNRYESYLYSLIANRPEMEYFWNEGGGLFLTLLLADHLIVGSEYRYGEYVSTPSLEKPQSFSGDDQPWLNPAIDDGAIGSLLFRLEWSSDSVEPRAIGGVFRSSDASLVIRPRTWGLRTAFQTLNTLEIARPSLDSDARFDFTRFVTDNKLILATGARSGVRLRLRVMHGAHLPRQRQDGLGGWSALRGFEFKEFRGDRSILGIVEYRRDWLSGFLDVGAIREPDYGWTGPHFGLGAKLHLDSIALLRNRLRAVPLQLVAAWRLDGGIKATPELRLQLGHLF